MQSVTKYFATPLFVMLLATITMAQPYKPELKVGTKLTYHVDFNGTKYDVNLKMLKFDLRGSRQQVKIEHSFSNVPNKVGIITIGGNNLDEAKNLYYALQPGESKELNSNLIMTFGRKSFDRLMAGKKVDYELSWLGKKKFVKKNLPEPIKLDDKELDVVYAESEDGVQKIWILNHDAYPLIVKMVSGQTVTLGKVENGE